MTRLEMTPARVYAILAAFYPVEGAAFRKGELTDEQIGALLQELGFIRYLRDYGINRYAAGKVPDDGLKDALNTTAPANPDRVKWVELYTMGPYGLLEEDAAPGAEVIPGMSPEVADAICQWWERGDCPDWAWMQVLPWHKRIIATAGS